ncbi:MAG: hypothetical protein N2Z22_05480 [Turneriella sp.]|nr:hypothetical protein [Leptospiraceae bacterium]MCX7632767.1 hypothetical protein [Turneriella sp.]
MKKVMVAIPTLLLAGALAAVQIVDNPDAVKGCERLGEIVAGDKFVQLDRNTVEQVIREEAQRMRADKVFLSIVSHNHPKLGKQYSAKAVAWKCGQ